MEFAGGGGNGNFYWGTQLPMLYLHHLRCISQAGRLARSNLQTVTRGGKVELAYLRFESSASSVTGMMTAAAEAAVAKNHLNPAEMDKLIIVRLGGLDLKF